MTALRCYCHSFATVSVSLITSLTVCGTCRAFLLTEEAGAGAVKPLLAV